MTSPFESGIDAAVVWPNGKAYFFKGDSYLRFDIGSDRVDQEPRLIRDAWPGWPTSWTGGIQGAVVAGQVAYFFRGSEYLRYDIAADRVSAGYPKPIAGYWHDWPADWRDGIDGCVGWTGGLVYFFKGGNYIRYDLNQDKVTRGSTPIAGAWGNWPWPSNARMNGGAVWPNGTAYLFSGSNYIRYSVAADTAVSAPTSIKDNWRNWPGWPGAHYWWEGARVAFQNYSDRYITAEQSGAIMGNRDQAGAWESFTLEVVERVSATAARVRIRSSAHNTYVIALDGGGVMANSTNPGAWETWLISGSGVTTPGEAITFKSWRNRYLSQDDVANPLGLPSTPGPLIANYEGEGITTFGIGLHDLHVWWKLKRM